MDEGTKRLAIFLTAIVIVISGAYMLAAQKSNNLVEIAKYQSDALIALANTQSYSPTNNMQGKEQEALESLLDEEPTEQDNANNDQAGVQADGSLKLY